MSPEIWAPIGTTLVVGVGLLTLGWFGFNSLRQDINGLRHDVANLNSRLSHIEGWIQGRFREGAGGE